MTQFTITNCDICDKQLDDKYNELNDHYYYKIIDKYCIHTEPDICNQCLIDILIKKNRK